MIWRIRRRATFEALRRPQRRNRSGPISIAFVSRERLGSSLDLGVPPEAAQFAFSVPRRVGTAVVRNTVRRRLRAAVASHQDGLAPGAYLVSAAPEAARLRSDILGDWVGKALEPFRER